jgi:hypothetical protein
MYEALVNSSRQKILFFDLQSCAYDHMHYVCFQIYVGSQYLVFLYRKSVIATICKHCQGNLIDYIVATVQFIN